MLSPLFAIYLVLLTIRGRREEIPLSCKNRLEFQKATPGNCFISILNNWLII